MHAARRRRRGISYVEVVVASVVFGLTLAGLGATIVSQERLMRAIERRVTVLAGPGVEVAVGSFEPPGTYAATRAVLHPADDLLGRIDAWAARLGAGELVDVDGRPETLPVLVAPDAPTVDAAGLSWTPPGLPPDAPDRLYSATLRSRSDDGTSGSVVVDLAPYP